MNKSDRSGDARIHLVPYDASWPSLFEREREILKRSLAPWLAGPIEHIGSTAVPHLAAKPVIDIMVPVKSLATSRPAIPLLSKVDYVYFPYNAEKEHWFCKPSPALRTHHLHLVPFGSQSWVESLAFRDYLRRNSSTAAEYAALKLKLAEKYEFDREGYTQAKGPFVQRILALALLGKSRAAGDSVSG
jgi:GrpB-like predicted nucleotidyltransferase (UPF0157 family)